MFGARGWGREGDVIWEGSGMCQPRPTQTTSLTPQLVPTEADANNKPSPACLGGSNARSAE